MIEKSPSAPAARAAAALAFAVLWLRLSAGPASAWQDLGADIVQPPASSWFTTPVRVGFLIPSLLVAWSFGFFAFFPWLLRRKHAPRPLAAYGLALGLIWVAWCGIGLAIFGDRLILDTPYSGFVNEWSLTCVIVAAAVIGFVLARSIFGARGGEA